MHENPYQSPEVEGQAARPPFDVKSLGPLAGIGLFIASVCYLIQFPYDLLFGGYWAVKGMQILMCLALAGFAMFLGCGLAVLVLAFRHR